MPIKRSHRPAAAVAGAFAAVLLLAACGGEEDPAARGDQAPSASATPSAEEEHNAADVAFAQRMIPHHRQAVEMADLALAEPAAASGEVRELAEAIRAAQQPEIDTLSGWLAAWGEEVPGEGTDHSGHGMGGAEEMGGMDGMEGMQGMMSEEEMAELENASGTAFDTAFLEMMTEHHEGAVAMAETELAEGAFPPALELAEAVVTTQTAEIQRMSRLLGEG
ncbi:DUF305 domain-containing protein [Streptomyces sp. DSM 44917]|uniref:DUF305 domain-containing protein n=1 Tax=Streptomyces boetiae TaxID=3075541 RepID=A0ABU2L9U0_9ACTN|nr:DUF305 domain-containing protein [Streptomyces sp. DSM 44917]MDT0308345.1 DUF305 domain-containing protein [Streptomyces sp. DSM 44917]